MRFARNLKLAMALYREDVEAHIGDIAVLKADSIGSDVPRARRSELDPVRGYLAAIDLEKLLALPKHTFGHAYARWMAWLIYPLRSLRPLAVWRAYRRGLRMGRNAPFLLGRRLEESFDRDIDEFRAELGLLD